MTIRTWSRFLLLALLVLSAACSERKISEEEAAQIALEQMKALGLDLSNRGIVVMGPPTTLQEMETAGRTLIARDDPEYTHYRERLGDHRFWKCMSAPTTPSVVEFCYVLVDATDGAVLYVVDIGANTPIEWKPD